MRMSRSPGGIYMPTTGRNYVPAQGGGSGPALILDLRFTAAQGFGSDTNEIQNWHAGGATDAKFGANNDGLIGYLNNGPLTNYPNGDFIENGHTKPDGSTGRIFRHVRAYNPTVPTGYENGGGFAIHLTNAALAGDEVPEMWCRWYQRWQTGMHPTSSNTGGAGNGNWLQTKCLYINVAAGGAQPGWFIVGYGQGQQWGIRIVGNAGGPARDIGGAGWQSQMGGDFGDGIWHYEEFHVKKDNGISANGIAEAWFDDPVTPAASANNVNWSGLDGGVWPGWHDIVFGSNAAYVGSDTPAASQVVDYDFIAISLEGQIGPYDPIRGF